MAKVHDVAFTDLDVRINDLQESIARSQRDGNASPEQHAINESVLHTLTRMLLVLRELAK